MEQTSAYYKYCITPLCTNTIVTTPHKIFIRMPPDAKKRENWLKACRRGPKCISVSSRAYVCGDHFNLEEDMENYTKFKMLGGSIKMKNNVVPHIFDWQVDRKRASTHVDRPAAVKRPKSIVIEEAIASTSSQAVSSTSAAMIVDIFEEDMSHEILKTRDVAVTAKPHIRSKSIQCCINLGKNIALSPIKQGSKEVATSPLKLPTSKKYGEASTSSGSISPTKSGSTYECTDESENYQLGSSSTSDSVKAMSTTEKYKLLSREVTFQKLTSQPRLYMGVPEYAFYIIPLLEKYCKLDRLNILLTLKKIRTARSFAELGDDFGMSESNASRIFSKSLPHIEKCLRKCIVRPNVKSIKKNLPLPFRARYSNVSCIIDSLEIEIQKPSDALKHALTWSDYKKCNTLKYLIASTPDGIINFISTGYGGRTSDATITEQSGILNALQPGTAVMADRGFKHIEHLLCEKGCSLVRPPSVSSDTKCSKSDVLQTKRIASLRIHVERVIRRIGEFSFCEPHACINNKLIPYTNLIITVVCGLINLQSALISRK